MILLTLFGLFAQLSPVHFFDGYLNKLSVLPGDSVELYLNASEQTQAEVRLYDLQGTVVARYTLRVFPQEPARQKPWENGFNYKLTARVAVPQVKSGVYLWENNVPMIVKATHPKIVVVYPSNTENAYSNAGGKSLYDFNSSSNKRAEKVSFLRPIPLPRHAEAFLEWMAAQSFDDVGYITDRDLEDYHEIKKASLLILPGHSEYWTLTARKNFDRFVHEGKNALVLSGNTMWWQVRYSKKKDQLICYRSADEDKIKSAKLKTINWNDPSLGYPILRSIGVDFSLAGYGLKIDKGWDGYKIITTSPLLENTALKKGDILPCPSDELDGAPLLGFSMRQFPVLNRQALGFEKAEIVGFDMASRGGADGVATWIVFKPTRSSGIVINTASTDWCSHRGIGSNDDIKTITFTMINKLLKKENVFSPEDSKETLPVINN